jgi:tryptophan 2,3-dioxygenase
MSEAELGAWFYDLNPERFPYEAVVREFHDVGKQFVSADLLRSLDKARSLLPQLNRPWSDVRTLACFLDTALDKPDGRYDYPTYLALSLLQLPSIDDPPAQTPFTRGRCDRLIVQLATDALQFELDASDGHTGQLPGMRPAAALRAKRYRLGVRAIRPALARLSLISRVTATEPEEAARQACAVVHADMSLAERRAMLLSTLPVHTVHDEYMFLRVLQMFETTFALLAVHLQAVLTELASRDVGHVLHFLDTATGALKEAAPLFSMLATMQVESFRTFRQFTEGASAIQSRNYKTVESLCRRPEQDRLDSVAYTSVPEVRERVRAGQATLDEGLRRAGDSAELSDVEQAQLTDAMTAFAAALRRWRTTHYRLAVRMLGDSTGTGYTEGTPYLAAARSIPVFTGPAFARATFTDADEQEDDQVRTS